MKIEIIVTTMHQTDFSILDKMKIDSDVIIANQADRNEFATKQLANGKAMMITSTTRGLSKNRNIGLEFVDKDTDFVMFADDDLVFDDGYIHKIKKELEKHPEADAIKFNLYNISKTRQISMGTIKKWSKANRRSVSSSGVCGAAIKYNSIVKYNLHFNEYFGTGTTNYCGEDSIFLQDIISNRIQLYLSPVTIAGIDQTESSWFQGHNEKYFTVAGMVLAVIFPKLAFLLAIRSAYRFSKREDTNMKFLSILKAYYKGIISYKQRI